MRSCVILGSGRSGTSMLAGTLHGCGYYMGEQLLPPSEDNPKGFFEDREVNSINEALLASVTPRCPPGTRQSSRAAGETCWGWRWLAEVPLGVAIPCSADLRERIRLQTSRRPFCFKDPRFCYTLPAWREWLSDAVFLCVFREPARTARSMVKTCERGVYLHGMTLTFSQALALWLLMYRHVLDVHCHQGRWLFMHYEQILDGSALARLQAFLQVSVEARFADRTLKRSVNGGEPGAAASAVYEQLCALAHFQGRAVRDRPRR